MKKINLIIVMLIAVSAAVYGQLPGRGMRKPMQRIEELEKLKLIEILQMDEETTLRFFARRSEHKEKMKSLNESLDKEIDNLRELLQRKESDPNSSSFKKEIDLCLQLESNINKERTAFINSLSDILTNEQIGKLIVFERQFREEIRMLLMKERMKR